MDQRSEPTSSNLFGGAITSNICKKKDKKWKTIKKKEPCDICYEEKDLKKIECCLGKKWCKDCEAKITDKCPFCRREIKRVTVYNPRDGGYFNTIQPYNYQGLPGSSGINMYSFSLNPQEHQPSGSLNYSRWENVSINIPRSGDLVNNMYLRVNLPSVIEATGSQGWPERPETVERIPDEVEMIPDSS